MKYGLIAEQYFEIEIKGKNPQKKLEQYLQKIQSKKSIHFRILHLNLEEKS